jgi:hypothetical protein
MRRDIGTVLLGLFAGAFVVLPAVAQSGATIPGRSQCFFARQFESWRAPDSKTLYVRVAINRYYRLDLSGQCPKLQSPGSHLVSKAQGSDIVCSAHDWDLSVAQSPGGFAERCVVRAMTPLSTDDVAAIPEGFKP